MGWRIKTLFQYNEMSEVILEKDRHLTSQPTQSPSVANEQHHSRQQDLAVHLSRTSPTVNVVHSTRTTVPLGQLPTITVQTLNEGKYEYYILYFVFSLKQ